MTRLPQTLCLFLLALALVGPARAAETLTLGMFAYRTKALMEAHYRPLADYLGAQLKGTRVEILFLDQAELEDAIAHNRLDLVFTNPSHYLVLRSRNSLTGALATVIRIQGGEATSSLGGVIVTPAQGSDIRVLADLRGRLIAVPGTNFLGGYQAQAYELLQHGIRLPKDAKLLSLGGHDAVVAAVLEGRAEAGFIRSGVLEQLAATGRIDPARLRVIHRSALSSYPYAVSTRLYPEWPFVALPHVDSLVTRKVASALFALTPDHPAARAAGIAGFGPPADYLPVETLARALRLQPYDHPPEVGVREIWQQYAPWLVTIAIMLALLAGAAAWLVYLNRRIRRSMRALRENEERLKIDASVFTHAGEGIAITDAAGTFLDVNSAFCLITGYAREEVLGRTPRILKSGLQGTEFYAAMWRELKAKGRWNGEIWNRRKDGEVYAELLDITAVLDKDGHTSHYVSIFSDITALKEQQHRLEHIAHYDALTGLPNRVLLADRMEQAMAQTQRRGGLLAVAFIDLDGFKPINDTHGHESGDQMLIAVARRMREVLRNGDTLARLGGDEFVAVLIDLDDTLDCTEALGRLLAAAAEPVPVGGNTLQVSASIGVSFYPQEEAVDADQLMRQADQAMYQAKLAGKNRHHFFNPDLDRAARGRYETLEQIRQGILRDEFVLHYQPKVNMRSGAIVGAEALIRWQHPARGLLPPGDFLPAVEDHALGCELGEWVIDTALAQMEQWRAAGLDIPVSVNVGAQHIHQSDFPARLRAILAAHPGIPPGRLELEVLETSALSDLAHVSEVILRCREIGVDVALDDFGTGYSTLTYLKRLPVSRLKIDQSFVRGMLHDPDDLAILEGVLGLAAAFRRRVIAEGMESVEHGELLLLLGCEEAQGHGIARPMPAAELPGWTARWRPDPAWTRLSPTSRDDLPMLFAGVEHHAWTRRVEACLRDAQASPPPLDIHQCRFGQWLDREGLQRYGATPGMQAIQALHRQVHAQAGRLLALHAEGRSEETAAGVAELHGLRDGLIAELKGLIGRGSAA